MTGLIGAPRYRPALPQMKTQRLRQMEKTP
jgi:hypothetical protein